jgi:hypothetical protein
VNAAAVAETTNSFEKAICENTLKSIAAQRSVLFQLFTRMPPNTLPGGRQLSK